MAEQLAIPLPFDTGDEFLATPENAPARALVGQLLGGDTPVGLLVGPQSSGKSTLARLFERQDGQVQDDADVQTDERALFHAINWARETATPLLITSTLPLGAWTIEMPDLSSRLRAIAYAEIESPSQATLSMLFAKRCADLQTLVDANVAEFVLKRLERSYVALDAFIVAANARALAEQRGITIPLARAVLAAQSEREQEKTEKQAWEGTVDAQRDQNSGG